jgi:DNA-binding CsgD family transcriptional regulator
MTSSCKDFAAFNRNIKVFLDYDFKSHVHVYGANVNNIAIFCNEYQDKFCKNLGIPCTINRPIAEFYPLACSKILVANNVKILRTQKTQIFIEKMPINRDGEPKQLLFLSVKTLLSNRDTTVGTFGFGFPLHFHDLSIGRINAIINELSLFPTTHTIADKIIQQAIPLFTTCEQRVAFYLIRGYTMKGIAKMLNLSHRTIEKHFARMKVKLGCYTKTQLISKLFDEYLDVLR